MSVEREGSLVRFNCDGPACHKNYEGDDFFEALGEAKALGWVVTHDGGTWKHYCPACKKQLGD